MGTTKQKKKKKKSRASAHQISLLQQKILYEILKHDKAWNEVVLLVSLVGGRDYSGLARDFMQHLVEYVQRNSLRKVRDTKIM